MPGCEEETQQGPLPVYVDCRRQKSAFTLLGGTQVIRSCSVFEYAIQVISKVFFEYAIPAF